MRSAVHIWKDIPTNVGSFAMLILISLSLALLLPNHVFAQSPPPDTTPPQLVFSGGDGELRDTTTLSLSIIDDNLSSAFIEVRDTNDALVAEVNDTSGKPVITLDWQTNGVSNGTYKVQYGATDIAGNQSAGSKDVTVGNIPPVVTLGDTADGHTIGGTVSRRDVSFEIKVDNDIVQVSPTIASTLSNGVYAWTAVLPDDIADKAHMISVIATIDQTATHSDMVGKFITLSTPPPVQSVEQPPAPTPNPILELAKEIGQFIAPVLPTAVQTQLFGVPTTDLTDDIAKRNSVPVPSSAALTPQPSRQSITDEQVTTIKSSNTGWLIMGIAWYWWAVIAALVGSAIAMTARTIRKRQREESFVRAESIQ